MDQKSFEKDIRKKLAGREITPSSKAWEQLSSQLDAATGKRKRHYWWLGVAAAISGVVFVLSGLWEMKSVPVEIETPAVVETPVFQEPLEPVEQPKGAESEARDRVVDVPHTIAEKSFGEPNETQKVEDRSYEVGVVALEIEGEKEVRQVLVNNTLTRDEQLSAEADSLLHLAQLSLKAQRLQQEKEGHIDSDRLLAAVERELDTTFREKVWITLKDGYQKVRTAMANRNN